MPNGMVNPSRFYSSVSFQLPPLPSLHPHYPHCPINLTSSGPSNLLLKDLLQPVSSTYPGSWVSDHPPTLHITDILSLTSTLYYFALHLNLFSDFLVSRGWGYCHDSFLSKVFLSTFTLNVGTKEDGAEVGKLYWSLWMVAEPRRAE